MIGFLRKPGNKEKANNTFSDILTGSTTDFIFERLNLGCMVDDRLAYYRLPGSLPPFLDLQIDAFNEALNGHVISIDLSSAAKQPAVKLYSFSVELQPALPRNTKMLVNGYQSWSRSELMGEQDRLKPLFMPTRSLLGPFGDYDLFKYSGKKGHLHSWSYTYFRLADGRVVFFGSLDERSGYTIFEYNYADGKLVIHKDCKGAEVGESASLLKLVMSTGEPDQMFDLYCKLTGNVRTQAKKISGWCSWYNYYTAVSESNIMQNLENLSKKKIPLDVFQIDDGWQAAIGDWLEENSKFPSGMQAVAREIEKKGYRPGLWLAPFICVPSSKVFRDKPHWLLRNTKGRPVKAGFNPGWGGYFYALDFYAPGVQDYLDQVFWQVQDNWGYRMLKFDFLYAAALLPHAGKSRGQIMSEAIDFITARTKQSTLLGCGVPLASAYGNFEYCRIGSDVGPYWNNYLARLNYRERVATENSLVCTIARKELDRRFFRNDPDVFILRDGTNGINENKLIPEQRYTLFLLNNLLGGLIFFSDNVGELSESQLVLLQSVFPLTETKVIEYTALADLHSFKFIAADKEYMLFANLSPNVREVKVTGSYYFHPELFLVPPGKTLTLAPCQSYCLYRVKRSDVNYYLLGAVGHIFPGAQVEQFTTDLSAEKVEIITHREASPETTLYVGVPSCAGSVTVNGQNRMLLEKDGFIYAKIDFTKGGKTSF